METLKTVWSFFQNEVLGMNWLNQLIATILNACGLDTTDTVSYTHLDVYKRQPLYLIRIMPA